MVMIISSAMPGLLALTHVPGAQGFSFVFFAEALPLKAVATPSDAAPRSTALRPGRVSSLPPLRMHSWGTPPWARVDRRACAKVGVANASVPTASTAANAVMAVRRILE